MAKMHLLSKIFQPMDSTLQKTKSVLNSRSHALLVDYGLIKPSEKGTFYYLPILQRTINKTNALIRRFMHKIDAQEISIPNLTSVDLWKNSGRFDAYQSELLLVNDRNNSQLLLGPTFEESITQLMTFGRVVGEKKLPIRLYQIGNKFRDEMTPRYGLLRAKEFIMKDLYTFDVDKESAFRTYEQLNDTYSQLFKYLGVPFVKVEADATEMGGNFSHEYHYLTSIGEAKLQTCLSCGTTSNAPPNDDQGGCPKCHAKETDTQSGIEVGHTFVLGDTYTKKQDVNYLKAGKPTPMQMGCYGIGVTRLIGAAIEILSTESHLRWPFPIAPFSVCIIPPEKRSKAFSLASHHLDEIYHRLNCIPGLHDSILVDDRIKITIGERMRDTKRLGIPLTVVIGRDACNAENAQFELHFVQEEKECKLSLNDLIAEVTKYSSEKFREE